MLMKDDDVAKAGGHSLVECERCSVPLNDTNHDDQLQDFGQNEEWEKKKQPTLSNTSFIHFLQSLLHDQAWLVLAVICTRLNT